MYIYFLGTQNCIQQLKFFLKMARLKKKKIGGSFLYK